MPSPSKTLKNVHRKQASGTPLKTFARALEKDKQHRDTVTAWHVNKAAQGKRKKKGPIKAKEAAAPPAAKGTVLKKR